MKILRFYFFFNLLYFWATPAWSANKLSKPWLLQDRKMLIEVRALDRNGKELSAIPVNQMIELNVEVKALDGKPINGLQLSKFDAQMPAHRHGMVTKPKISALPSQQYLIEGVKLHMPGMWQLMFDLKATSEVIQVAIPLNL